MKLAVVLHMSLGDLRQCMHPGARRGRAARQRFFPLRIASLSWESINSDRNPSSGMRRRASGSRLGRFPSRQALGQILRAVCGPLGLRPN